MSGYDLGRDAEQDLNDIWDYIAEDSVDAADRQTARLFDAFEALARNPGMGHKWEDLTNFPVLFWPVGSYLVIYRGEKSPMEIVAVVHGKRDIPTFLRSRDIEKWKGRPPGVERNSAVPAAARRESSVLSGQRRLPFLGVRLLIQPGSSKWSSCSTR